MRIISFNINGIRARPHQLKSLLQQKPDIVGLQETKCPDDQFPSELIEEEGYHVAWFGQKSHYGVALISKEPPLEIVKGFPNDDEEAQKRLIRGTWQLAEGKKLHVINGYFPQGENRSHPVKFPAKTRFYEDLQSLLETQFNNQDYLAIIGDFNISPTDADIGIGDANAKRWLREGKCSFLPEERAWMERLYQWGLTDAFRDKYPDTTQRYSWFDYRSRGFDGDPKRGLRIDLLMVTQPLKELLSDAGIQYDVRAMEKPSDHAPVWADFTLN